MGDNWLDIAQNFLFPPVCLLCDGHGGDRASQSGLDLCTSCLNELPYLNGAVCTGCAKPITADRSQSQRLFCGQCLQHRYEFDAVMAVFQYQTPLDYLIQGLKYNDRLVNARLLGCLMGRYLLANVTSRPDGLIPVPLHKNRLRERGYNQSLEIARYIAQELALPILSNACVRQRQTTSQTGLSIKERRKNVQKAFVCKGSMSGCYIVIIDDVMTTGSTVNELARELKRAGARKVDVWVCARALIL